MTNTIGSVQKKAIVHAAEGDIDLYGRRMGRTSKKRSRAREEVSRNVLLVVFQEGRRCDLYENPRGGVFEIFSLGTGR